MNIMAASVFTTRKTTWAASVATLLDRSGLCDEIDPSLPVIIKPNLVEALEPPITTPVGLVAAVVDYLRDRISGCRIIVGEGTGSVEYDTFHCYSTLGYSEMARDKGIELMDLNVEPLVKKVALIAGGGRKCTCLRSSMRLFCCLSLFLKHTRWQKLPLP